jgi:DEAD/DEAH box helicase domain-containing protein
MSDSIVLLIAQPDALDQYFMNHPREFFQRPFEAAVVDPNNSEILDAHLPCAAAEIPLSESGDLYGKEGVLAARAPELEARGELLRSAEGKHWYAARRRPHRLVDIRSAGTSYAIFDEASERVVGKNDGVRVFKECHPGALYLHRGRQHLVTRLDLDRQNVFVRPTKVRYYTRALSEKDTEILALERSRPVANFIVRLGRVKVTEQIVAYEKRNLYSGELLDKVDLDLPAQSFETIGFWLEIDDGLQTMVRRQKFHFMGSIHALEHALISMFPLFALCDRNDIGGIAVPRHPQLQKSAVFVYDGYPGGVGLADRGFDMIEELLQKTVELISACPCELGCPSCIHSPKCGAGNKPLDKEGALFLARGLRGDFCIELELENLHVPAVVEEEPTARSEDEPAVAFFDLETQRLAEEVGGWANVHLMRLAVAALYNLRTETFEIFSEEQVDSLLTYLGQFDLVVGFNIKRFDYQVLKAYTGFDFRKLPTFDILEDIYRRLGYRLSLAHLAEQNLGKTKVADGIQAVRWFRENNTDALIEYCKDDVAITRDLFHYGLSNGYVLYKNRDGHSVRLPVDWTIADILRGVANC